MFGEPDDEGTRPSFAAIVERVAWWAEVFEIPCVAYAGSIEEIEALCAAGADFVALGDAAFADPRGWRREQLRRPATQLHGAGRRHDHASLHRRRARGYPR